MGLRERWRARGRNWRFPTKQEAAHNLRQIVPALKRPWVIVKLLLVWSVMLVLSAHVPENTGLLLAGVFMSAAILENESRRIARRQRIERDRNDGD